MPPDTDPPAAWTPPSAEQVAAHLAAHPAAPPPAARRLAPLVPLAAAAAVALALGGGAWVLPWLALVGTSVWARRQLAERQRRQRRVERAHELARLRFNRPALRTAWRLLPQLTEHPSLHHAAVAVLARGLEQSLEADALLACLDHLDHALPPGHPDRVALDARRVAALVASGRLADADAAVRRLRGADPATPEHRARLAVAELEHAVGTAHYHEAINESPALTRTLRPLGLGAARGYALRALCHHHRAAEGDRHAAGVWWGRATALADGPALVAALPDTRVLLGSAADDDPLTAPRSPAQADPAAEPDTDDANDDTPTPAQPPFFTPQRLRNELAADRWLRRGVLVALPAVLLAAGVFTAWPLPAATLSALVAVAVGSVALGLRQAPVVAALPALAPLTGSAPPAADALLRRLTARRGLAAPLRRTLYHHAAALAHHRDPPGSPAATDLAAELLAHEPPPDTSSPAAAMSRSPRYAALLLIVAHGHLAAGRPAHAYPALAALDRTPVTLDQALERLALRTRYDRAVGTGASAPARARAAANLGALMPAPACRRLHRDLLATARQAGDADTAAWLARRVALLG